MRTAAVIGRMERLPTAAAAAVGLGIFQEAVIWNWSNTTIVDATLILLILGSLLLQREAFSRVAQAGASTWAALREVRDAAGRQLVIEMLDPGTDAEVSFANHYLANGAAIVPVAGVASEERALARLAEIYPDREIVTVPATTIASGGGGPHCITQQVPAITAD